MEKLTQQLQAGLAQLEIEASAKQQQQLLDYLHLLHKWNSSFNLSGIKDLADMVALHLLDSLTLSKHLHGKTILDIGTGAGLPGIPLAIVNPDKHFILLDSNSKKTRFLFQVKLTLGIDNITIENNRIEHYQSGRQLDIVTCRAFSSLAKTIKMSEGLLTGACVLLAMKGTLPQQEIDEIPPGYKLVASTKVDVPGLNTERHIIEIKHNRTNNF